MYFIFFFLSLFLKVLFFVFFWFLFSFVSFNPFLIYIIFLSPKHQHSSWEKIGFEREKRFSWYWITITYYICMITLYNVGRVAQSVATGYGLDGSGIESRRGARFSEPVQTGPEVHPASCTMSTGSFSGVKSGRGVTLTPHPLLVPWS